MRDDAPGRSIRCISGPGYPRELQAGTVVIGTDISQCGDQYQDEIKGGRPAFGDCHSLVCKGGGLTSFWNFREDLGQSQFSGAGQGSSGYVEHVDSNEYGGSGTFIHQMDAWFYVTQD
ncbi:hypothetical protein NPIL_582411 [Nephila pilipes]|uniref:Uncharacterized protein n=1 Tax=Nephila pilipes TaxID=299642 RepID=A0A8X6U3R2_NEPPI|nr:hypothetical protein NPIL_582411 [Nephila pilipes]